MKKWISVALATFCTVSFADDEFLRGLDRLIAGVSNQTLKQTMICEKEAMYIHKDPQQCKKALDMLLTMSKKATKNSLLRCEFFGNDEERCKQEQPDAYQMTDKEFFNLQLVSSYVNAGALYYENKMYEKSFAMYKKAIEYDPNKASAHFGVAAGYYYGRGITMNENKAYEHWRIAAKLGNQEAKNILGLLCEDNPSICK